MAEEIARIVVVEDDDTIRNVLKMMLEKAGFTNVRCETSGDAGLETVRRTRPDLLLLDLMLPGMDGLAVCRRIREDAELGTTKILMLTAKSSDEDVVRGLELGADDYVTKPFSRSVLLARVRALLRRSDALAPGHEVAGLSIDAEALVARLDGRNIPLTRGEFMILHLLASHPGRVYTRQRILDTVQGDGSDSTERTVDVQMVGLRRKLGAWAERIETVRGVGYRVNA